MSISHLDNQISQCGVANQCLGAADVVVEGHVTQC